MGACLSTAAPAGATAPKQASGTLPGTLTLETASGIPVRPKDAKKRAKVLGARPAFTVHVSQHGPGGESKGSCAWSAGSVSITESLVWRSTREVGDGTIDLKAKDELKIEMRWRRSGKPTVTVGRGALKLTAAHLKSPGTVAVPLAPVAAGGDEPFEVLPVTLKLTLRSTRPPTVKRLFLVRHGESTWNRAQRTRALTQLIGSDHPLTAEGMQQCHALSERVNAAAAKGKAGPEKQMLSTPVIASPQTRAVQSAALCMRGASTNSVALWASLRELKTKRGQLDNIGKAESGSQANIRAGQEAKKIAKDEEKADQEGVVALDVLNVVENDAVGRWWTAATSKESKADQVLRQDEFLEAVRLHEEQALVCFGHSLFFQRLLETFQHPSLLEKDADQAHAFASRKLDHCAVACVDLDFLAGRAADVGKLDGLGGGGGGGGGGGDDDEASVAGDAPPADAEADADDAAVPMEDTVLMELGRPIMNVTLLFGTSLVAEATK
jgi:broad specificity phosphatase PhoE